MLDIKKKEEMRGGERITVLGSITYDGVDIINMKPSKRAEKGIILCTERRRIFPESSALENLKIGGYLTTRTQAKKLYMRSRIVTPKEFLDISLDM